MPAFDDIPEFAPEHLDRFWSYVDKSGECWAWTSSVTRHSGRGKFRIGKRHLSAPRVAWWIAHGSQPGKLEVCHTCDNPNCVNPDHLWLGTHLENLADMRAKGRSRTQRGEANVRAKLTEETVREIRALAGKVSRKELGERYGVGRNHIYLVQTGQRWANR